jgi:hypothetical protein
MLEETEVDTDRIVVQDVAQVPGIEDLPDRADGALYTNVWSTMSTRFRLAASSISRSPRAADVASGFSTSTCLPARRAFAASSK